MKGLVFEPIDGERLCGLVTNTVLENNEFGDAIALKVGKACYDLEIRTPGCAVVHISRPTGWWPRLSIAGAGSDINLGVETRFPDAKAAAHVEWPAIPCDHLVHFIAVE